MTTQSPTAPGNNTQPTGDPERPDPQDSFTHLFMRNSSYCVRPNEPEGYICGNTATGLTYTFFVEHTRTWYQYLPDISIMDLPEISLNEHNICEKCLNRLPMALLELMEL